MELEYFVIFTVVMFYGALILFLFAACFVSARCDRSIGMWVPPDGDRGVSDKPERK